MKKSHNEQLFTDFLTIRDAARESDDGNRCMIAPSPELRDKLIVEMKKLQDQANASDLSFKVKLASGNKPVGFNDGLIYPGTMFPVGTSAEAAKKAAGAKAPLRGTVRVIVVLADFSDKPMTTPKAQFEDLFFSLGKVATGSVREYYREVTHGKIDIQGQVVGPYRMPNTIAQYAHGDSGTGNALPNARTLAKDAAIAANPAINFANYDNDKDGFVDAFIVIHAGRGGEETGNANDIWSHKWVLDGGAYAADGAKIYAYLTVPEDCKLGVCAHELGHLLFGFPDLYDADYSSEGIGNWCLMAGGSWNNGGLTPAHPSAWCKTQQNWVTVINQAKNQDAVAIEDVKTGFKVHRLWKNGTAGKEYFLVENRQKTLFDKFLPGSGVLVWHIDDAISGNTSDAHYQVALMQADGKKDLEKNANRGDGGDCYPGTAANKNFTNTSNPNSKSYAGAATSVSITNITAAATIMKADLKVTTTTTVSPVAQETIGEILKKEAKDSQAGKFAFPSAGFAAMPDTDSISLEQRVNYLETMLASLQARGGKGLMDIEGDEDDHEINETGGDDKEVTENGGDLKKVTENGAASPESKV